MMEKRISQPRKRLMRKMKDNPSNWPQGQLQWRNFEQKGATGGGEDSRRQALIGTGSRGVTQ